MYELVDTTKHLRKVVWSCDFCGSHEGEIHQCAMCGRDVCRRCGAAFDYAVMKPGIDHEAPDFLCKDCWTVGEMFIDSILRMRRVEDDLFETWTELAKIAAAADEEEE